MARKEIIEELAALLDNHRPAWVIGCDCMPICEETGVGTVLEGAWEEHVANIIADFFKEKLS